MRNGVYDLVTMILFIAALLVSSLVFFSPARAQDENPLQQWVKDHVKGNFLYKNFAHFKDTEPEQRTVRQEGILRLEVEQTFLEKWRLFLMPQWKADTANYTAGGFQDFRDTYLRDSYFSIREGHLKYRGDDFDVSVGKQIYVWGAADGYNPTDNLNPRNYLDVPEREKMGIFSFAASYFPPDSSITLVVLPFFTPSRLPLAISRWASTGREGQRAEALGSDVDADVTIKRREMPGKRLDKIQLGLRGKTTVSGWDFSLSYFDGYDTLPVIRQIGEDTARPRFNRMRVIGMDFTTTSGKLEYHGEWAWKIYDGGRSTDILPFVLGGTYTWDQDQVSWLGLDQVIFTLEYGGEFTLHQRDSREYKESGIFTRPFQNSILSRLALKIDEDNELQIGGNINFHHHNNSVLQPKYIHKFSDSLKAEAGVQAFWGSQNSFWGKWKRNDRTFVIMTYSF